MLNRPRYIPNRGLTISITAEVKKWMKENGKQDPEVAHLAEDELLWTFVQDKAALGDMVARYLLTIKRLKFPRWYA
jgi:hypothetical protein